MAGRMSPAGKSGSVGMIPLNTAIGVSEGFLLLICRGFQINAVSGLSLALTRCARELVWVGLGLVEFSLK